MPRSQDPTYCHPRESGGDTEGKMPGRKPTSGDGRAMTANLTFHPLTPDRWDDLERLFGPERGADSGCWCMFWRLRRAEFHALGKEKRKAAFRGLVAAGAPLGMLAYDGAQPVGRWPGGPAGAAPAHQRLPCHHP